MNETSAPPYDLAQATADLTAADAVLGDLIAAVGPCTLEIRAHEPFVALLRAIVYQQLSGKAAGTIHGRVLALFGAEVLSPEALLAVPDEALRGAGLSRAKTRAVKDLAEKTLDGTVPDQTALQPLTNEEVIERLTAVRGVGPWTVEMLLMFTLGRPDVLPVADLGVRHGYRLLYDHDELPSPSALRAHGERWRPWRSVASWYLWRAVDRAR
ncbi:MAG: DNA-3-methyladenine glycosylase 2 family protein [Rhodothermaceae bacterium]|nr:DNA-3-methyladenine glycosylase 2 family protein [Rhodothermaceae bacterium]